MRELKRDPLRWTLQGAINARQAALRNNRSHRKDLDRLRAAIGRAEVFLRGYPYARDEQVTAYCIANREDVALIVPGNRPTVLGRLITEGLKDRSKQVTPAT